MDIRPGIKVFGNSSKDEYEVIEPIGGGSFGVVYKVRDSAGNTFALKTFTTAWLDPNGVKALMNEGQLATEISHENVVRVFYFHDGNQHLKLPPYMLMEYADGGTLQQILDQHRQAKSQFDLDKIVNVFFQLTLGM
jgi:eukaryotic-like serine/threonine-protein kinase